MFLLQMVVFEQQAEIEMLREELARVRTQSQRAAASDGTCRGV